MSAIPNAHLAAADSEDGFLVKRHYFDDEEVSFVRRALVEDATLRENVIDRQEAFGASEGEWQSGIVYDGVGVGQFVPAPIALCATNHYATS